MSSSRKYSLNGLVKNQPLGAEYIVKKLPKKQYLVDILGRLKDDVGVIVECVEERNKKEPKVGFFPMARIIMPIIEVVATSEGREPQALMKELGMRLPFTEWNLYRDVFLHNDEFVLAAVGNQGLQVAIYLTSEDEKDVSDILVKDGRNIDPFRIRRSLIDYLENKINKTNDTETVEIIGQLVYDPNSSNPEVQQAVKEIRDFHTSIK